ncbi:hypothetical protein B0H11DRAFT_1911480 [Mycena galericulata]|nr:hypothetical protein B0H11DRAFT_1911480 [Mycena galericulata]
MSFMGNGRPPIIGRQKKRGTATNYPKLEATWGFRCTGAVSVTCATGDVYRADAGTGGRGNWEARRDLFSVAALPVTETRSYGGIPALNLKFQPSSSASNFGDPRAEMKISRECTYESDADGLINSQSKQPTADPACAGGCGLRRGGNKSAQGWPSINH